MSRQGRRGSVRAAVALFVAASVVVVAGAATGAGRAAATLPKNTSSPTISGTARAGQTLTGSRGSWTGSTPITYTYQWYRCSSTVSNCEPIPGATNETYTLNKNDVGNTLIFFVHAANSAGGATAGSAPTGVVAKAGRSPANTFPPTISGTPQQGATLTAHHGSWVGTTPITYSYQWRRCGPAGGRCGDIGGATAQTYTLAAGDVGHTIRVRVTATNSVGRTNATSVPTGVVTRAGAAPVSSAPPTIAGTPQEGQTLTADHGTWSGTQPITYSYQWLRCGQNGGNCSNINGATGATYRLVSADIGTTLRVRVTASNPRGAHSATSVPTGVVSKAGVPAGAAIAIGDVSLPNRLIIDRVSFSPNPLRSKRSVVARFRVSDSKGHVVQGALVFLLGIPYGQMSVPPEQATGADGYVTFVLHPGRKLSLRSGALVFFVRARKPGENLLAGVSTRRLVQLNLR
jgi:hypothetical protein